MSELEKLSVELFSDDDDQTPESSSIDLQAATSIVFKSGREEKEEKLGGIRTPTPIDQDAFNQLRQDQTSSPNPKQQEYTRCVIVSWRIRQYSLLTKAIKANVLLHQYKSDATLDSLLLDVQGLLNGEKVASIAFICHGNPGTLTVCHDKVS